MAILNEAWSFDEHFIGFKDPDLFGYDFAKDNGFKLEDDRRTLTKFGCNYYSTAFASQPLPEGRSCLEVRWSGRGGLLGCACFARAADIKRFEDFTDERENLASAAFTVKGGSHEAILGVVFEVAGAMIEITIVDESGTFVESNRCSVPDGMLAYPGFSVLCNESENQQQICTRVSVPSLATIPFPSAEEASVGKTALEKAALEQAAAATKQEAAEAAEYNRIHAAHTGELVLAEGLDTVNLMLGDAVAITKKENGSTGYSWVWEVTGPADGLIRDLLACTMVECSSMDHGMCGAPATKQWTFVALMRGAYVIQGEYKRVWEDGPGESVVRVVVNVS